MQWQCHAYNQANASAILYLLSSKTYLMNVSRPADALLHFICPLFLVLEFPLHKILSEYPALPYFAIVILLTEQIFALR